MSAKMRKMFLSDSCLSLCQQPGPTTSSCCGTYSSLGSPRRAGFGRRSINGRPRTAIPRIRMSKCSPSLRTPRTAPPQSRNGGPRFWTALRPRRDRASLSSSPPSGGGYKSAPKSWPPCSTISPPGPGLRNDWWLRRRPSSMKQMPQPSLRPALSRGWFRLYGAILSASCSPSDAARQQIAVDTDPSILVGLRAALRNAIPVEIVECALEIDDPRMPKLAGEVVAKKPQTARRSRYFRHEGTGDLG